jgi:hypothetical protein
VAKDIQLREHVQIKRRQNLRSWLFISKHGLPNTAEAAVSFTGLFSHPRKKSGSTANSLLKRISRLLISCDGSVSSTTGNCTEGCFQLLKETSSSQKENKPELNPVFMAVFLVNGMDKIACSLKEEYPEISPGLNNCGFNSLK